MFKRINTYLIENHPNIWHLRLPFLILTGFIFHIFAFLYGFLYINEQVLAETNYYQFSFDSSFILVQVILMLIVFFFWGLQFYKNSVLKNYYRAGRFYGVKLFSLLVVLFFWNISSFVTFDCGISVKRDQLAQKYNVDALIKEKEFLNPLLLSSEDDYELRNNPKLNASHIQHRKLTDSDENDIYLCTKDDYLKQYKTRNQYIENCRTKLSEIDSSFYSRVDNSTVIFYEQENLQLKEGCNVNVINKFLKLDGYHWNELRNHPDYSSELDKLLKEKKYKELIRRMEAFKQNVNSIYPFTNFDPQINLNYISQKRGRYLKGIISHYYENGSYRTNEVLKMDTSLYTSKEFRLAATQYFYFQENSWDTATTNLTRSANYYSTILTTFIFSVIFAYFLLQFQIINFINFAITVPIAGVMIVVGILFSVVMYRTMEDYTVVFYLLLLLACLIIVYRVKTKIKERANEVFILLFASLIPTVVLVTYGIISMKIYVKEYVTDSCADSISRDQYFQSPPFYEWHLIILGLLSCFGFLLIVKRLKSKPE